MADLMHNFESLNIPIDECTIEEFMHINGKNNEVFLQEIFDDVIEVLETMQTRAENVDESDHVIAETWSPFLEPTEESNFCRFQNIYKKVLEVEDPELQAQVGDEYSKL